MKNLLLKILFVIGIIVVLILLAGAIVKVVPKIVASLGSTGGAVVDNSLQEGSIEVVTSSQELTNDEPFGLTWKADESLTAKEGIYALAYSCVNDVSFDIIAKNGASKTLICNTPFTLGSKPTEITLKPSLLKEDSLRDVNLAIVFFENGIESPTESGKKIVSVRNFTGPTGTLADNNSVVTSDLDSLLNSEPIEEEPVTDTTTPPAPTTPVAPAPTTPVAPRGPADLSVGTPIVSGNIVQFPVSNIGERPSGQFTFTYTLPGESVPRVSPLQQSLNPGESLGLTITVNQSNPGGGFSININADNRVTEVTKLNNVVAVNLGPITGGPLVLPTGNDLVLSGLQTSATNIASTGTLTVFFNIKNNGGATSAFTLEVISPTLNQQIAPSGDGLCALRANKLICSVPAMAANEKRDYSFNINNLARGNNQAVQVLIDTQNVVSETSESNNQASVLVNIF